MVSVLLTSLLSDPSGYPGTLWLAVSPLVVTYVLSLRSFVSSILD